MHKRYRHISSSLITQTLNNNSVLNASQVIDSEYFCKSCAIGKSRKLPHKLSSGTNRSNIAGHTFHIDLVDPMSVVTWTL